MNKQTEAEVASQLVLRILAKDQTAEQEMVQRYNRGLLFMLNKRSQNKALAEDIAQETWRIVIEKVRNNALKSPEKLAAFIVQTGKNQLIMNYRSSHNTRTTTDIDTSLTPDPDNQPEKVLEKHNLAIIVRQLINELKTPRDRELIMRFYLREESKENICHDFGLSELHFNRVLFRARQRFKQLWNQHIGVER